MGVDRLAAFTAGVDIEVGPWGRCTPGDGPLVCITTHVALSARTRMTRRARLSQEFTECDAPRFWWVTQTDLKIAVCRECHFVWQGWGEKNPAILPKAIELIVRRNDT